MIKRCTGCKLAKPIDDFYIERQRKDGHQVRCKTCQKESFRVSYAIRPAHRERIARQGKMWWSAFRSTAEGRAKDCQRVAAWCRAHPENVSEAHHLRRARLRGATIGSVDYAAIWAQEPRLCGICSLPVDRKDRSFDHIVPLARGGSHAQINIQLAHRSCNSSKGARWIGPRKNSSPLTTTIV